jgi:hypothetical protein
MSKLEVDAIEPQSGTTLTIGASGDTVDFPSGVSLTGAIPSGVIMMWSGTTGDIPTGFVLCDGSNGTPNLTDKFIKSTTTAGTTGGGTTTDPTTLTTSEIPSHAHTSSQAYGTSAGGGYQRIGSWSLANRILAANNTFDVSSTGGGGSHTHGQAEPVYYSLIFIMKT